ncbi:MAG: hypothetical protein ACHQXJ_02410, partial [Nitrososphaerales archaeon]
MKKIYLMFLIFALSINAQAYLSPSGSVSSVFASTPILSSGGINPTISIPAATASVNGYLAHADFSTFNSKQSSLIFSAPLVDTSDTVTCNVASGSQSGCLASADWTTFNGKYNLPALTAGSVLFSDGSTIAQNNANFFWDNTNTVLKLKSSKYQIGSADPYARRQIWNYDDYAVLRLGSWQSDGDATNSNA